MKECPGLSSLSWGELGQVLNAHLFLQLAISSTIFSKPSSPNSSCSWSSNCSPSESYAGGSGPSRQVYCRVEVLPGAEPALASGCPHQHHSPNAQPRPADSRMHASSPTAF